ncbi:MAG: hypothetical protein P4L99_19570 [Chthoniobacter sp.]|nr:hypothetical protein [Chthoniobacter sp.]
MENENLDIKAIMESRRRTIDESLCTISVPDLKSLTEDLFPYMDDPWFEMFVNTIENPNNHRFYHAIVDDRIQLLYCRDKEIAMWFIPGIGKGRLDPEQLRIVKEIVDAKC